jgi:hypothetical protein
MIALLKHPHMTSRVNQAPVDQNAFAREVQAVLKPICEKYLTKRPSPFGVPSILTMCAALETSGATRDRTLRRLDLVNTEQSMAMVFEFLREDLRAERS